MDWSWSSSTHRISDIWEWSKLQRLEIRPDFQRKEVWSVAARILLMDTILKNIPMPKLFLQADVRGAATYRFVIDGQQRLKAILDFLKDGYRLNKPFEGEFIDKSFSELPENIRNILWSEYPVTDLPCRRRYSDCWSSVNRWPINVHRFHSTRLGGYESSI